MPLQFPQFEKGSLSAQYQEIANFCVAYTEGLLVDAMHLQLEKSEPAEQQTYELLQEKLQQRERTLRHAFQFQIEKQFNDFKLIRRTRLHENRAGDWLALGLAGHSSSLVQAAIDNTSEEFTHKHDRSLRNLVKRLQTLVHRSDDAHDDNPVGPRQLCNAFIASIEALKLTGKQTCQLMEIFHQVLEESLQELYQQLDLGLFYLDVLPELTDPKLFAPPQPETEALTEPEQQSAVQQDTGEKDEQLELAPTEDELLPHEPETTISEEAVEANDSDEASEETPTPPVEPAPVEVEPTPAVSIAVKPADDHADEPERQFKRLLKNFRHATAAGAAHYATEFNRFRNELAAQQPSQRNTELDRFIDYYTRLLENPRLSVAVRIQLSRLVQPLLLLTLEDPQFFENDEHPAQKLILSVIDFDIRHGHTISASAFIATLFDQLLINKHPDADEFAALLKSFKSYEKAELRRLKQDAEAQERRRRELAEQVLETINKITGTLLVEQEVLAFFYDDWQLILLHLAEKAGPESDAYLESVEIGRKLAWLIDENHRPNPDYEKVSFTALLKAIEKGLKSLDYSSQHRNRVRKLLIQAFRHAQSKLSDITVKPVASSGEEENYVQFNETIRSHTLTLAKLKRNLAPTDNEELDAFLDDLQLGSWVEIKNSGNKRFQRGKLKWKAPDNSRFIFIDQRGHKINESHLDELKSKFEDEQIRILSTPKQRGIQRPVLGHGFQY